MLRNKNRNWIIHVVYIVTIVLLGLKTIDNDRMIFQSYHLNNMKHEQVVESISNIYDVLSDTIVLDARTGNEVRLNDKIFCRYREEIPTRFVAEDVCTWPEYRSE